MDIDYKEIADRAVAYAKASNINLDYSEKSIEDVDYILGYYYEHLAEYDGTEGADTLWNIAVHFGIYLGETMLRLKLKEKGYEWQIADGMPVLKAAGDNQMSPITKAHKRILEGPGDSVKGFCDVAFAIADGKFKFPRQKVHRAVDVELSSGRMIENVLYKDIDDYIGLVASGEEDFLILKCQEGFLQFYGVDDQFVAEMRVNLANDDFHTYSLIDNTKENKTNRVTLVTPFGQYTPMEQAVISRNLLKTAVQKYYETICEEDFLKEISCIDITQETKRCMGLI